MKKYTIILEIILILLSTNGCGKEETSKDESSILKEPHSTLTLKFGSFQENYNIRHPIEIELELTNNGSENCIIPWYNDFFHSNAELYLRKFGTNDEWIIGFRDLGGSSFPSGYEMVIPPGGKLNFWIVLTRGLHWKPTELTPGKYEMYSVLIERTNVITTTQTINIYDDPLEKEKKLSFSFPPLIIDPNEELRISLSFPDLIINPNEEHVPINLSFQSLPEKVPLLLEVEIILKLENNKRFFRGIDPWYFNNKFNVQIFCRPAGTNEEWKSIQTTYWLRKYTSPISSSVMMMYPSIRYTQLIPPKGKLTFPVKVRKRFSPGEYEVYASLTALPKVKTEIKIIRAVRK